MSRGLGTRQKYEYCMNVTWNYDFYGLQDKHSAQLFDSSAGSLTLNAATRWKFNITHKLRHSVWAVRCLKPSAHYENSFQ